MKVGDRIRVFEVKEGFHNINDLLGKHFCETLDNYFGNEYGVNLPYLFELNNGDKMRYHANIDNDIVKVNHIKHVATMVIKSIK